ncbi:MAG: hypothetical protein R3E89_11530 [Thiolinea sp.]
MLEAAGVNLDISPEQVAECIDKLGVGFLFAQKHHSAMRHAIGPRKDLGVRTLFNLLGPLTNPAGAPELRWWVCLHRNGYAAAGGSAATTRQSSCDGSQCRRRSG